ncbi:MAG: hypothetical protein MK135_17960, partial [Polyangiaceae bacterium]|nr:hypothetical protein [Polyangiaceae bacterium]
QSGISIIDVTNGQLGAVTPLVTSADTDDGSYHFYPTWSPDAKYIAFVTSWDPNIVNGNYLGSVGNAHGVLRMVEVAKAPVTCPGPDCIELTRGTGYAPSAAQSQSGTQGSTWPKFAPFAQGSGSVYFITYTARRQYGLYPDITSQLWMFGIDTTLSGDPSFPPFWLPYQDIRDGSLSPYWTETLPCEADVEADTCEGCLEEEYCQVNEARTSCACVARSVIR